MQTELREAAYGALCLQDPDAKCRQVQAVQAQCVASTLKIADDIGFPALHHPGIPKRPELVEPHLVPRRKLGSIEGRAALIHAIAHIEFNAINLALDAIARFSGLPADYYTDWLRVAAEEAYHYGLLTQHLAGLGYGYGDFPAHNGLWEIALKTADDPLARMGLVPRILEARGLDVTPSIQTRLRQAGDHHAADVLEIILRDEIGHVRIGNRWYHWLCEERGRDPATAFRELLISYAVAAPHPPFNIPARLRAGFTESELQDWS